MLLANYYPTEEKILRRIIYLSASSVYGNHQGRLVNEESQLLGTHHQARSRIMVEKRYLDLSDKFIVTIFRLAGIYGPSRNPLEKILSGKLTASPYLPPAYIGNSDKILAGKKGYYHHLTIRIHLDDIVAITRAALASKRLKGIFNLSDDKAAANYQVNNYAAKLLGKKALPKKIFKPNDKAYRFIANRKLIDNSKIKKFLKYQFIFPDYQAGLDHEFKRLALAKKFGD